MKPTAKQETNRGNERLRGLPSVTRLLAAPGVAELAGFVPQALLTEAARTVLDAERARRQNLQNGAETFLDEAELAQSVTQEAQKRVAPSLLRAVNATGIVLHTGLGRARLSDAAQAAIQAVAGGHATVEIEPLSGKRGMRRDHVRGLLRELTGAEDATVVNNCAGAVFLAVNALTAGKEVILSRGELVEIGGAFRMPDIVRASGAFLVEVGTTNRTRLSDYESAITERTGLILRCHPSNFAMIGFTEETPTPDLVRLGRERGIPVMDDQGSGALFSLAEMGVGGDSGSMRASVGAGCDIVAASGDKLLGGPQAGILLGNRDAIEQITRHPLARALRVDKLTLAGLEATLRCYRDPEQAKRDIPTLRYLLRTEPELKRMAQKLRDRLRTVLPPDRFAIALVPERSQVGGGSLPGEELPTWCVSLRASNSALSADEIAQRLRMFSTPIFARIKTDAVLLDSRTIEPEEIAQIVEAARSLAPSEQ